VSVLPFEGTHPILFGGARVVDGTRIRDGYLARPDVAGSHSVVVLVPPIAGLTSGVKDLCRRIARHGIAAFAMDPYRGKGPGRRGTADEAAAAYAAASDARAARDLDGTVRWLRSPGTEWADPDRVGLLGIGTGGRWALLAAADLPIRALAVCYSPLGLVPDREGTALEAIGDVAVPLLGIYGRADATAPATEVTAAREAQPRSEWVIYEEAGHDFLDDGGDTYDAAAAKDAIERLVAFFQGTLR
jgi:carboxymethylenebutenolidase